MAEPADRPQPAKSRPRRSPRFVLPDDHHDERTAARIEAFLDGPSGRSRRREAAMDARDRPRRPHELDTRLDWMAALLHESSRHSRYGRPASVLLIELDRDLGGDALDQLARSLAEVIRQEAREADRAVRTGAGSFRMLLPETNVRAASHVATRLDRAFRHADGGRPDPAHVQIEIAAPARGRSLEEALAEVERRIRR